MFGDDLGVAHIPTPVETVDLILLERGEYRALDVILSKMVSAVRPGTGRSRRMYDHS